jgi:hypothetical protein
METELTKKFESVFKQVLLESFPFENEAEMIGYYDKNFGWASDVIITAMQVAYDMADSEKDARIKELTDLIYEIERVLAYTSSYKNIADGIDELLKNYRKALNTDKQ